MLLDNALQVYIVLPISCLCDFPGEENAHLVYRYQLQLIDVV
jgi:hypothetical protein